ncbi:hypothetical protein DY000_02005991 [Brassica cretica]|uniref:Uncharacterized protein n=1 Tax=Brassica cretica TaxID=69181 RepID=A0ABQ7CBD2_BRACR|nr:hypothetical protein DY000_02005991 [Brassica cretica]
MSFELAKRRRVGSDSAKLRCSVIATCDFYLLESSHVLFPWSSPTWTKGLVTTVHFAGRKEKHLRLKAKSLRVTSFKGGFQISESGGRERGKKATNNNSVKLSYRSDDVENNVDSSSKSQNTSVSYTSETEDSITGQPAIQKLFKKWLSLLLTQSPIQVIDEALEGEHVPHTKKLETETEIRKTESLQSTNNTFWSWFWSLDTAIKIPLLLFVPAFLAVNAIYGAEVTKELSPLWIFGPLIVAFYIQTFQGLCALYAFCFNQTTKVIRNLPSYYIIAYHYISHGKLKDDLRALVTRPIVNTDYRELTRTKLKQVQEWIIERYLDFVESIWPYYCRTIRFLKRANLI